MEANELNVEYGYRYQSAAVAPDGTPEAPAIDDIRLYQPGTRPAVCCRMRGSTTKAAIAAR